MVRSLWIVDLLHTNTSYNWFYIEMKLNWFWSDHIQPNWDFIVFGDVWKVFWKKLTIAKWCCACLTNSDSFLSNHESLQIPKILTIKNKLSKPACKIPCRTALSSVSTISIEIESSALHSACYHPYERQHKSVVITFTSSDKFDIVQLFHEQRNTPKRHRYFLVVEHDSNRF